MMPAFWIVNLERGICWAFDTFITIEYLQICGLQGNVRVWRRREQVVLMISELCSGCDAVLIEFSGEENVMIKRFFLQYAANWGYIWPVWDCFTVTSHSVLYFMVVIGNRQL